MKKYSSLVVISLITLTTFSAWADEIPKNAVPMSQVLQNIQRMGYSIVTKVEYDDGKYVAKVIANNGDEIKLEIAPLTGEVIKSKDEKLSIIPIYDIVQQVETARYKNIYFIEAEKDKYVVKAFKGDKKVGLDIDAESGQISE